MNLIEDSFIISLNSSAATSLNGNMNSNVLFNTLGILKNESNILYNEISVLSAQIPVSFYAINSTNNVLNYQVTVSNYSITITAGNYSAQTLITELQTQFLTNGHTFNITLNSNTGVLTFSGSFSFLFQSTSTCGSILGFVSPPPVQTPSFTCPYQMNSIGQTHLKVCSKSLPTKNYDSLNSNVLAVIPISVPSYNLITWENTAAQRNILNTSIINNIDIQILDQNNNFIDFMNQPWTIVLKLSIFRNIMFSSNILTPNINNDS